MLWINKWGISGVYGTGDQKIVVTEIITHNQDGIEMSDPFVVFRDLEFKGKDPIMKMISMSDFNRKYRKS